MFKWRLLVTTLPFVAIALIIKLTLRFALDFEGMVEFSDIGVVLTGAVFLIGFMLSGTMSDFKESEKIPAEIACSVEALEENLLHAAVSKPDALNEATVRTRITELLATIRACLYKKKTHVEFLETLTSLHTLVFAAEKGGASSLSSRAMGEIQNLRKIVTRASIISRTEFLASGYALLDTLVVMSITVLMIAKFKSTLGEVILVPVVTLIFVYMVRLIRDLDDPFGYGPNGEKGAADVELIPLDELDARRAKLATVVDAAKKAA